MLPELRQPRRSQLASDPDWMPDRGIRNYVTDLLEELGVDTSQLPRHWIPLVIHGGLEWICACGWWIFKYAGIWQTDWHEKYLFIWRPPNTNQRYEFDPDKLFVFLDDPEANMWQERMMSPGISGLERTEAVMYIMKDIFDEGYGEGEPPQEFVEMALWATFMWVLSDNGRDWIYMLDPVLSYVIDHQIAYMNRWDGKLLDHTLMERTERQPGSCFLCGERVWCTSGYSIDEDWLHTCQNCLHRDILQDGSRVVDEHDHRLHDPKCPSLGGDCYSTTCPHSGLTEETLWQRFQEHGSERVEAWRQHARDIGAHDRMRLDGVVRYYSQGDEDVVLESGEVEHLMLDEDGRPLPDDEEIENDWYYADDDEYHNEGYPWDEEEDER